MFQAIKNFFGLGWTDAQYRAAIEAQKKVIADFGPPTPSNGVAYWGNKYALASLMVKYHKAYPNHAPLNET